MWIVIRPFTYRGKRYQPGEQVPAESWNVRRGLQARGKIRQGVPNPEKITRTKLKSMTRAELNFLATQMGIEGAELYPNRESLISQIKGDEDSMEELMEDDERENLDPDVPEEDDSEEVIELDNTTVENLESEDAQEDESDDDSDDEDDEA